MVPFRSPRASMTASASLAQRWRRGTRGRSSSGPSDRPWLDAMVEFPSASAGEHQQCWAQPNETRTGRSPSTRRKMMTGNSILLIFMRRFRVLFRRVAWITHVVPAFPANLQACFGLGYVPKERGTLQLRFRERRLGSTYVVPIVFGSVARPLAGPGTIRRKGPGRGWCARLFVKVGFQVKGTKQASPFTIAKIHHHSQVYGAFSTRKEPKLAFGTNSDGKRPGSLGLPQFGKEGL